MATTNPTGVRIPTEADFDDRAVLRLGTFLALVIASVGAATAVALPLAQFTESLGGFVLLAAGWLAVVCASPALARRGTARIDARRTEHPAYRPIHSVDAVVTALLTR